MSLKHYRDLSLTAVPGGTIVVAADAVDRKSVV